MPKLNKMLYNRSLNIISHYYCVCKGSKYLDLCARSPSLAPGRHQQLQFAPSGPPFLQLPGVFCNWVCVQEEPRKVCFNYDLFLNLEGNPPVNHLRCEKLTFNNPTKEFRRKLIKAGGVRSHDTAAVPALLDPSHETGQEHRAALRLFLDTGPARATRSFLIQVSRADS